MDATARIKNLSIALEALSRIVGQQEYFDDIQSLLKHEIRKQWEENHPLKEAPARPVATTTDDDDNPF